MSPVAKALWYIDSHFRQEISLDDIAACAGVSRFHLLRAFGHATGQSVMTYVRGRRLSAAAQKLAGGAVDILSVAIESGYGSHEAFTRAFREQFNMTPESVRHQGHFHNLPLTEAQSMQQIPVTPLHAPRFEDGRLLTLAGLAERFGAENCGASIPGLWQKFGAYIGHVPGQIGGVAYGVCHNFDEAGNMDYLCGVEVTDFSSLPREFARLRITPQHYVVFTHSEHVSAIRGTWNAIWGEWLPQSGHEVTDAPFFERYDTGFNPQTGYGGMELWIPLKH